MNGMQFEFRSSRIEFFCILRKTVRHRMRQPRSNDFIAVDIDITKDTERAQIINTTNMVIMDMRNQHTIYLPERHTQQLLSDIRSGIYQNTGILRFYHCRTAQSFIMRIRTSAHFTVTPQRRNTARCACT